MFMIDDNVSNETLISFMKTVDQDLDEWQERWSLSKIENIPWRDRFYPNENLMTW